jgi:hypothetical protein
LESHSIFDHSVLENLITDGLYKIKAGITTLDASEMWQKATLDKTALKYLRKRDLKVDPIETPEKDVDGLKQLTLKFGTPKKRRKLTESS